MPIQEQDRVLTHEGKKGVVGVISGDRLSAYVQLDEHTAPDIHYMVYEMSNLTKFDDTEEN